MHNNTVRFSFLPLATALWREINADGSISVAEDTYGRPIPQRPFGSRYTYKADRGLFARALERCRPA